APEDYQTRILPHVAHILKSVEKAGVPVIHFGTGTTSLLELQKEAGGNVIGIDFRTTLTEAHRRLGNDVAYQGNLEPMLLLAPWDLLKQRTSSILEEGKKLPGHIFNLGHGIVPQVDPNVVTRLVEFIHETSFR